MGFFVKFIEAVIEKFINWFSRDAPKPAPVDPEGYNKEIERRKQEIEKLEQQQKNKNEEERRKNEEERLKIEEARRKNEEELKRKAEDLRLKKENFAALKNKRFEIRDPGMVQRYREEAKRKIDIDSVKKYNIAITGQTGSGKSSYVNAVRGIRDDDERAAKVDEKQVLTPMTKYQHPTLKTLDIWDCPGAGTAHHPLETYFMDKYLYMFDGLVIVYENRFQEVDADLLFQANAFSIPAVVVRNKANKDLEARWRRRKEFGNVSRQEMKINLIRELKDAARQEIAAQQGKIGKRLGDVPIYVINAWAITDESQEAFEEAALIDYVLTKTKERRN